MDLLDYDTLRDIMPHAPPDLMRFVAPLNAAMEEFDISTPQRASAFLAQLAHESGSFRYMEELANGSAYEGRTDLGNHLPEAIQIARIHGSTPGRWFKGHGPIQITGYYNHKACGEVLGLDLLNAPRLLCEPEHGCRAAGWFWWSRDCNSLADQDLFERITRRINGGINGLADREAYWERAKAVLYS